MPTENRAFRPLETPGQLWQVSLCALALTLSPFSARAQQAPSSAREQKTPSARRIVVSIPDRRLALVEGEKLLKTYPVAVGAPATPSPGGEFQIVQRLENPAYYYPGVVIRPGAQNPLGTRWIGLSLKGFGIHGTNRPDSIGESASHGCIRLRNQDMEDLFARVRVGDRVTLIAERTDEVARLFGPVSGESPKALTVLAENEGNFLRREEGRGNR